MSFSVEIKKSLTFYNYTHEQEKIILYSYLKNTTTHTEDGFVIGKNRINKVSRFIFSLIKNNISSNAKINVKTLKEYKNYYFYIPEDDFLNFINTMKIKVNKIFNKNNILLVRSYSVGLFLSKGYMNTPSTKNYHLELKIKELNEEEKFLKLTKKLGFDWKEIKQKRAIYIKKPKMISDFLKFINAVDATLAFEDHIINRDMFNNINRLNNIDISNERKSLSTSLKQKTIAEEIIQNKTIYKTLNNKETIILNLRLKNPEATYLEIIKLAKDEHNLNTNKTYIHNLFKKLSKK